MDPESETVKKTQQNIFSAMCSANAQDESVNQMLEMVCEEDVCPWKFTRQSFRKHLNFTPASWQVFIGMALELVWVVKELLAKEMANNKGSLLDDGWSKWGRHFFALVAMYIIDVLNSEGEMVEKTVYSLLGCSTLPCTNEDNQDTQSKLGFLCQTESCNVSQLYFLFFSEPDAVATKFDADTHATHITEKLKEYKIKQPRDFALARVCDNTAVNPAISRKLLIPQVGCHSHKLNLGGKETEKDDPDLAELCSECHTCHMNITKSNKTSATFQNAQNASHRYRRPKDKCKTRWAAMLHDVLDSHVKGEDEIRACSREHPEKVRLFCILLTIFF